MSQTKAQLISDLVQALNFTGTASAPANGLFLSAANELKLATASSERLMINADGLTVQKGVTVSGIEGGEAQIRLKADEGDDNNDTYRLLVEDGGTGLKIQNFDGSFNDRLAVTSTGVDVTGAITSTGNLTISNANPIINFTDTNNDSDFRFQVEAGTFLIEDTTNAGADRLKIASDGTVDVFGNLDVGAGIDVTGAITGTGDMTIDTNTLHVDSSNNRVGIGTTSPAQMLDVNGAGIIRGNTQILGTLTATLDGNQGTQGGSGLVLTHSTNTNLRANHFIVDDFPTNSGTYFIQVTESGVSNARDLCLQGYGGNVKIGNQGTAAEEKLDVEGNIKIRGGDLKISDNRGIDFSLDTENESGAGSSTGQLLDDYEEGTWTPVFDAPNQASTTFGLNHQYGYYTKIGNLVHVTCYLQGFADANNGGGSNDGLEITGLPFTVANLPGGGNTRHAASFAVGSRYRLLVDDLILHAFGNSTNVKLFEHTNGNTMVTVKTNQATARSGTNEVYFAGSYRVHA